ncbi:hypothetical protein [Micromonospora haikouensis]|uniref:hypothetical protein n=1 Tax=Micromonospora haikouensis TaxID=686309 RepID=UPI003D756110
MQAQEALSKAREAEQDAGNTAMARTLNELVLTVFRLALDDEMDDILSRAWATRDATDNLASARNGRSS